MLTILEKADLLQGAEIFREVRTQSLARVAAITEEVSFHARQKLYSENEPPDFLLFLLEGEILLAGSGVPEQRLGRSQTAGAFAVLANRPQSETAVTSLPVQALRISQQALFDAMAEDFHLTRGILRTLVAMAATRC